MMRDVLFRHLPPWEQPAVPKEQSGGDGSVQRKLCVFVPDTCNTFPLPKAILPVRRCRTFEL